MKPRTQPKPNQQHPLRVARIRANLTQQQVADIVGVTKASVCDWEMGRHLPQPSQAVRIGQLFPKVTMEKLYSFPRAA